VHGPAAHMRPHRRGRPARNSARTRPCSARPGRARGLHKLGPTLRVNGGEVGGSVQIRRVCRP
jgi:hypothetical protein